MSATFRPYFGGELRAPSSANVGYLPVRVAKGPRAHGSVTVYLPDGTVLDVRAGDLLRLDPGAELRSRAPEQAE